MSLRIFRSVLTGTLLTILLFIIPIEAKELVLASIHRPGQLNHKLADGVLSEALRRLGMKLKVRHLTSKRALVLSNAGDIDGEATHDKRLSKNKLYPNLVIVNVPILKRGNYAYSKKSNFNLNGYKSLKEYKIGIKRRGVFNPKQLQKIGAKRVSYTDTIMQAFKMLANDRVEFVIYSVVTKGSKVNEIIQDGGITRLEPPLRVAFFYTFLNKKHASLVPKLEKTLNDMKQDGSYKKILKKLNFSEYAAN